MATETLGSSQDQAAELYQSILQKIKSYPIVRLSKNALMRTVT